MRLRKKIEKKITQETNKNKKRTKHSTKSLFAPLLRSRSPRIDPHAPPQPRRDAPRPPVLALRDSAGGRRVLRPDVEVPHAGVLRPGPRSAAALLVCCLWVVLALLVRGFFFL